MNSVIKSIARETVFFYLRQLIEIYVKKERKGKRNNDLHKDIIWPLMWVEYFFMYVKYISTENHVSNANQNAVNMDCLA